MHYHLKLRLLKSTTSVASRSFNNAATHNQALKLKVRQKFVRPPQRIQETRYETPAPAPPVQEREDKQEGPSRIPQRRKNTNAVGVQLLTPSLHQQVFGQTRFPGPTTQTTHIALSHLRTHGLYPEQASVLPEVSFQLPKLQGSNLMEHFHTIGAQAAEPYLSYARQFAASTTATEIPIPELEDWELQRSGWTKYVYMEDGSSYSEAVPYPMDPATGHPEQMLTFDVETLPKYHPYPIMACALSQTGWYAWVSPWLLGETEEMEHLVPLGPSEGDAERIVVGHNVSYDRARIQGEYSLQGTKTRFLDTMALHVAVKGISSNQRPQWMKYRKNKQNQKEQQEEAVVAMDVLLSQVEERISTEEDPAVVEELTKAKRAIQDTLESKAEQLESAQAAKGDVEDSEGDQKRWEDMTSANSLLDVYSLYYPDAAPLNKSTRNDMMTHTREEIRASLPTYLDYCAMDVWATHRVYAKTLPAFLEACPHPVSFAGILTMGSSILTVDQNWEKYIHDAEKVYNEMKEGVRVKLIEHAEKARDIALTAEDGVEPWLEDPWLSQLDWTMKPVGKTRGLVVNEGDSSTTKTIPKWFADFDASPFGKLSMTRVIPALLRLSYNDCELRYAPSKGWHYFLADGSMERPGGGSKKVSSVMSKKYIRAWMKDERLSTEHATLATDLAEGTTDLKTEKLLRKLAQDALKSGSPEDPYLCSLDWTSKLVDEDGNVVAKSSKRKAAQPSVFWPKWYWDLAKPRKDAPAGSIDVTVRNRIAPILLRLSWLGYPLIHSREHGWTFRVPDASSAGEPVPQQKPGVDLSSLKPLAFYDPADEVLADAVLKGGCTFYKLPHKDGETANVGSPLTKTFMKFAEDGTLGSESGGAKEALEMNAKCSYWISARDRIMNQMVVWENQADGKKMGFPAQQGADSRWGIILPQVITMGTVTRRAIERTWLTASNAKANRVGSELKAMVRAPPGYSIVGADVDSEELWISSCMGDAQFGMHGATAIGWMTLEGTKSAGTDLHSKTASILGISRDQAKVFNYSRIYGAGNKHAVLLLMQNSAAMKQEQAKKLADTLYASTKGQNTQRMDVYGRKFWFGGTESFLFNKLEEIALSDRPQTPALGCGITSALTKEFLPAEFGSDYLPSRINWVVQSSGVDYLHLLIVSMQYLIEKYDINARYLISVHDELRYLVHDDDRYRASLALQIANLWTRSMFAVKLGMDNLPQGVAFFSAVDVDKVLRKEVDMTCVTPSQPVPIPAGESLDIGKVLEKTAGGSLLKNGGQLSEESWSTLATLNSNYVGADYLTHRAPSPFFLKAQASSNFGEVKRLVHLATGQPIDDSKPVSTKKKTSSKKPKKRKTPGVAPLGNGEGFDWTEVIERYGIMYSGPRI
ncbi:gamma DNA-directed DNA polymerase [Pterulicium gracile]|uniref:DNA-directed DNA polymerase n=1 Tax=Pterulicium gracile TaxID=1884261 RepID=A0A5C3QWI7_9AGAR|nr:gamma DNA-directed DNA polymerase [Pterula gracilis]